MAITDDQIVSYDLDKRVTDFLARRQLMLIGGERVEAASGETFATEDPATATELTRVPLGAAEDVDRAVGAARRAFEDGPWPRTSPYERGRLVQRLGDLIAAHATELAQIEALDAGKNVMFAQAVDVASAVQAFHYQAGWADKVTGTTFRPSPPAAPSAHYLGMTLREPVGVVGAIIPWNFPLLLLAWKLAPALATGNTVVLKPAEQTPLSALFVADLVAEAGFPRGVVNVVTGFGETAGAALAAHPMVDKISFTGSTEVGREIVRAASGNLKKVSLELGGKSPNIVFDDADLSQAVPEAALACFFNQGEVCCAGTRLLVQSGVAGEVAQGVADFAAGLPIGPGMDPTNQIGPLVSKAQLDRVVGYIDSGTGDGARALTGGRRHGSTGYFVEPTVLVDARPDMSVVREEVFGPVLSVLPFEGEEDLLRLANDTSYGLAAAVWTGDVARAHRVAGKLQAGTVWVNCYNTSGADVPFGGYKQSGWGRENGREVLDLYTQVKTVLVAL